MIRRNYLAVDIGSSQLRGVSLRRKAPGSSLRGGRVLTLREGALVPSLREPNVRDPDRFVAALREVLDPLAGSEERIALSLPDASGRILLTEVETVFKTKSEGIDVLRWQLRNSLPLEPSSMQLDYQVLERSDGGKSRLLVGLTTVSVIEQYEELVNRAGYNAAMIGFHSLDLFNFYRSRIDTGDDLFLVGVEGSLLSLQFFHGGLLCFHRARQVQPNAEEMFREVVRTLVGCQDLASGFRRATVLLHSDWDDCRPLLEAFGSAFEREVVLLDPHLERFAPGRLDLAGGQTRSLVGVIGAAERMM